jgi:hypothetical protein
MRCILVNDAHLKAGAYCSYCRTRIRDSYIREIGTRFLYCDFECYRGAAESVALSPTEDGAVAKPLPANAWQSGS